jgi:cell pole-organizing protein PopZ
MGDIQQDPSMEEILASIKRVIAEDGRVAAAGTASPGRNGAVRRPVRAEVPPEPQEPEDVLELDDPVADGESLLSPDTAAASRQKLAALSALQAGAGAAASGGGADHPLEAVVREMLRPMLKEWLDRHLPELVEELVTREIARITGRSL